MKQGISRATARALCAVLLLATASPAQTRRERPRRPKLVILLVVDQMRADYVENFRQQWSAGLARLVERGAWFRLAAYPYWSTRTCVGHYDYDTRVPVAMMGFGIRPGEYLTAATPADIAPTLALLCGVTLARSDGRVLTEALVVPPAPPAKAPSAKR